MQMRSDITRLQKRKNLRAMSEIVQDHRRQLTGSLPAAGIFRVKCTRVTELEWNRDKLRLYMEDEVF